MPSGESGIQASLDASDNAQVAVGADLPQIPGDEETVISEFGPGLFRHPPVAFEDIGALHLYQTALAWRQFRAGYAVGDAPRDPGQRQAHRAGQAQAIEKGIEPRGISRTVMPLAPNVSLNAAIQL